MADSHGRPKSAI